MSWNRPVVPNGLAVSEHQMDLKGKVIAITGAAQGLGQKMAEAVAARGQTLLWSTSTSPETFSSAPCRLEP